MELVVFLCFVALKLVMVTVIILPSKETINKKIINVFSLFPHRTSFVMSQIMFVGPAS